MTDGEVKLAMKNRMPVRMTEEFKQQLRQSPVVDGAESHVEEFGECQGFVVEWTKYTVTDDGNPIYGPEVDVYWQPSNLRYGYLPENLEWAT